MDDPADTTALDGADQRLALIELYDTAVADVYGYLYRRCGSPSLAEDLTSETFLAAAAAVCRRRVPSLTVAWLITVARNKLVDHWRRAGREERAFTLVGTADDEGHDTWDAVLDEAVTREALALLGAHHRSALTLRYLDGLSVPETAALLHRSVGATEVLLVRARRAFRHAYETAGAEEKGR